MSALLRVRNEEEFLGFCLQSISDWCDEVVIADQCSTDNTLGVINQYADPRKTKVLHYPVLCRPNGPGFDSQPRDEFSRAYFYDWVLEATEYEWAVKWDGDMIALDDFGYQVRDVVDRGTAEAISVLGHEIVRKEGAEGLWVGKQRHCGPEPRIFKVRPGPQWSHGTYCERFELGDRVTAVITTPGFLHMKWCKPMEKATQAWPRDWANMPHFSNLLKRAIPLEEYKGELPRCLRNDQRDGRQITQGSGGIDT